MAINQENMQNGENGNGMASAQMGNRMIVPMQGNVQGNGMSPMMMSRQMRQGDEEGGSNGASKQIKAMKERKRAAHKAKREMYESKQREAIDRLARLTRQNVTDDKEGVKKALAYAFKNGTYSEAADAVMAVIDYCWGCCETKGEDAAREAARSVEEEDMD